MSVKFFTFNIIKKPFKILEIPALYNKLQKMLDVKNSRLRYVEEFIMPKSNSKILDIGCGTGAILDYLPANVQYTGYDVNPAYIEAAKNKYGERAEFFCDRIGVNHAPSLMRRYDIVLATGLIHHLNDEEARHLLQAAYEYLTPQGTFISLDGVYLKNQSFLAKLILSLDRGEFVRTTEQYEALSKSIFNEVKLSILDNLLPIPYDHIIMTCKKRY